jgi:hypothetical protein
MRLAFFLGAPTGSVRRCQVINSASFLGRPASIDPACLPHLPRLLLYMRTMLAHPPLPSASDFHASLASPHAPFTHHTLRDLLLTAFGLTRSGRLLL